MCQRAASTRNLADHIRALSHSVERLAKVRPPLILTKEQILQEKRS